jgi:hypothetical protein
MLVKLIHGRCTRLARYWPHAVIVLGACFVLAGITGVLGYFRTIDGTAGKDSHCEVHSCEMLRSRVPVRYGLAIGAAGPAPADIRLARFPHARTTYLGGCTITPTSPHYAYIYVCRECQAAQRAFSSTTGRRGPG